MVGGGGFQRAISRASTTSSLRKWSAMDQPTIMRDHTSRTAQQ